MEAVDRPEWMITPEKVERALSRIIETSRPRRVFLFGSYVRGEVNRNSDLDVLVVVDDAITNPRQESVRIRRSLRDILMPMDILVVPNSEWEEMKEQPGLIYREIYRTGKVVYESA